MKVCILTGEASGDLHGANLIAALRLRHPELTAFGTGGDALALEGVEIVRHVRELGIVGLVNVLRHVPMFLRLRRELVERVKLSRPDVVILVDFPEFNLSLARRLRHLGIPIVYYISPQVWAWRRKRVSQIARVVDHMIVIFPFEESFYREHDVAVSYVGHPLVEQLSEQVSRLDRSAEIEPPVQVALLPGSRRAEVEDLLPAMIAAVGILQKEREIEAFVVRASTIEREQIQRIAHSAGVEVTIVDSGRDALASAHIALASSGTATLECAVLEVPVVVMYRLSAMTYRLARWLVKIPYFSLVNITAGRLLVPELLQDEVQGARIASEASRLLTPSVRKATLQGLREVRERLGEPGAARRAAEIILDLLQKRHSGTVAP